MRKVKTAGFFRELPYGEREGESLTKAVGRLPPDEIELTARYLRAGVPWIASPGITRDVLSRDSSVIGAGGIFTDGKWAWHRDLHYYVEHHAVQLPRDFVKHMADQEWIVGAVDITDLEL